MNLPRADLELLIVLGKRHDLNVFFIEKILSRTDKTPKLTIKDRERLICVIDTVKRALPFTEEADDFLLSQLRFELDC